jgi:hypothetical protein
MPLPPGCPVNFFKFGGATTVIGAAVGSRSATDTSGGLEQYPRRRSQQATRHTTINVHGTNARQRVIAALIAAFPHKAEALRTVGKEFVIEGVDARRRVLSALARFGRMSTE